MNHFFNIKRFWLIIAILAVIEVLVLFAVFQWRYLFPSNEVSVIYRYYEKVDGIDVTYIKGFKVNDTVFVDVTMLEAKDSLGWAILKQDFMLPELDSESQQFVDNNPDQVFSRELTPMHYPKGTSPDTIIHDVSTLSFCTHTFTIFHSKSEAEKHAVHYHNYDEFLKEK